MITKEMVEGQIKSLTALKEDAITMFNKAQGALELAQYLLKQFEVKDHLTESEIAEMVGGPGARVESITPSG